MLQGLRTAVYKVADLDKAKAWYSDVLGIEPYFDEPFYVGYNVGGYELGLDPDMSDVTIGNSVGIHWGVADVNEFLSKLKTKGIELHSGPQDVGGGIIVASVLDPFGNVFGIIENPHFKLGDAG
jgi:catechol 2,3-dioxygenase-like lactoylglutathione lyase family enzyme